jgi:hypothetical protein
MAVRAILAEHVAARCTMNRAARQYFDRQPVAGGKLTAHAKKAVSQTMEPRNPFHLQASPSLGLGFRFASEYIPDTRQPMPTVKIDMTPQYRGSVGTPPLATLLNCSADISSDESATACKYSSAVKGVPALSDNWLTRPLAWVGIPVCE